MSRYKKIEIKQIPDYNFEGYYWFSDSPKPKIIKHKKIDKNIFTELSFIVEANFYSKENEISIQVKNIDGKYHIAQIDVKDCEAVEYIGHDINADFKVVEYWEDKEDEFLEGMTTKVPTWVAFKGFVKSKKNKND